MSLMASFHGERSFAGLFQPAPETLSPRGLICHADSSITAIPARQVPPFGREATRSTHRLSSIEVAVVTSLLQKEKIERQMGVPESEIQKGQEIFKGAYDIVLASSESVTNLKTKINLIHLITSGHMTYTTKQYETHGFHMRLHSRKTWRILRK